MKKIMMTLVALLTIAATGKAMSYEQARNEALFLTDKMAYELNLTDEQYEAAYEINLDYLMGVNSYDDVYSTYWERRNLDMSYILLDWQWQAFINASYFYRPLYWDGGYWHFGIYARYPHRDYFFFGRPVFYASYRGGHAWHYVGGHGYYHSRRDHYRPAGRSHFGMLDRWNRGDYRGHHHSNHPSNSNYGGHRHSSTRTTVNNGHSTRPRNDGNNGRNPGGSNHGNGRTTISRTTPRMDHRSTTSSATMHHATPSDNRPVRSSGSFGGGSSSRSSGSFGGSSSSRSSGSFSGGSSSRSSGSFSGGSSNRSSGSFSGGSSRGGGSSHSSGGGRSFGGRR